jgi:hypothetical protein
MLKVTRSDVPNHLRSGERYKAMLVDPVGEFEVPCHCFKTDLSVQNADAAIYLLSTLQHWKVNDFVPVDLVEWMLEHPDQVLQQPAIRTLAVGLSWLERIIGVMRKTVERDSQKAPIAESAGACVAKGPEASNVEKPRNQSGTVETLQLAVQEVPVQLSALTASDAARIDPLVPVQPTTVETEAAVAAPTKVLTGPLAASVEAVASTRERAITPLLANVAVLPVTVISRAQARLESWSTKGLVHTTEGSLHVAGAPTERLESVLAYYRDVVESYDNSSDRFARMCDREEYEFRRAWNFLKIEGVHIEEELRKRRERRDYQERSAPLETFVAPAVISAAVPAGKVAAASAAVVVAVEAVAAKTIGATVVVPTAISAVKTNSAPAEARAAVASALKTITAHAEAPAVKTTAAPAAPAAPAASAAPAVETTTAPAAPAEAPAVKTNTAPAAPAEAIAAMAPAAVPAEVSALKTTTTAPAASPVAPAVKITSPSTCCEDHHRLCYTCCKDHHCSCCPC